MPTVFYARDLILSCLHLKEEPLTQATDVFCSSAKLIAENRIRFLFLQLLVVPIPEFAVIAGFLELRRGDYRMAET